MDEVRIWNYALTSAIVSGMNREIPTASGMVGRWGLNEGTGTIANDSAASHVNGTIVGANWSWVSGGPVYGTQNAAPVADAGADQSVTLPAVTTLAGAATDDGVSGADHLPVVEDERPGNVIFGNPASATTTVDFTQAAPTCSSSRRPTAAVGRDDDSPSPASSISRRRHLVRSEHPLPTSSVSLSGSVSDDGLPSGSSATV